MLIILIVTFAFVAPLHWAASYADADESTYQKCFLLSVGSGAIKAVLNQVFSGNTSIAFWLGLIISVVLCIKVLKIPNSNIVMFIVMWIFFWVVLFVGLGMVLSGVSKV